MGDHGVRTDPLAQSVIEAVNSGIDEILQTTLVSGQLSSDEDSDREGQPVEIALVFADGIGAVIEIYNMKADWDAFVRIFVREACRAYAFAEEDRL